MDPGYKFQWNLSQNTTIFIHLINLKLAPAILLRVRRYCNKQTVEICQVSAIHYSDVIMGTMASQITSLTIVYSTIYSGEDQRKHQSSASLAFVQGIHRWPVNSRHKWTVTRKMLPFDDVIMPFGTWLLTGSSSHSDNSEWNLLELNQFTWIMSGA